MIKIIVLASMVALAFAQYGHGGYAAAGAGYGHDLAQPTPYQYGFDIHGGDAHSGDFKQTRQEVGDGHGNVQGSYSYVDAHGIQRQVNYVADGHGFRAQVQTNEPGTESQSPADVELHSSNGPGHAQALGYGGPGPVGYGAGHGLY